jgi:hypothetical protein
MRSPGAVTRKLDRSGGIWIEKHRHGGKAHQTAIAGRGKQRLDHTTIRLTSALEPLETRASRQTNIKAAPVTAEIPLIKPATIARHLVEWIITAFHKTARQAERHTSIVSPLTGPQPKRPAAQHISHRRKGSARHKFNGSSNRIPTRKPQHTAAKPFFICHDLPYILVEEP